MCCRHTELNLNEQYIEISKNPVLGVVCAVWKLQKRFLEIQKQCCSVTLKALLQKHRFWKKVRMIEFFITLTVCSWGSKEFLQTVCLGRLIFLPKTANNPPIRNLWPIVGITSTTSKKKPSTLQKC